MSDLTVTKLHCLVCNMPAEYGVAGVMMCGSCAVIVENNRDEAKTVMTGALIQMVVRLQPPTDTEHAP